MITSNILNPETKPTLNALSPAKLKKLRKAQRKILLEDIERRRTEREARQKKKVLLKLERVAFQHQKKILLAELKVLQNKKKSLNQECYQQTSKLLIFEKDLRNDIRAEFEVLKRMISLRIKDIHRQLKSSKPKDLVSIPSEIKISDQVLR